MQEKEKTALDMFVNGQADNEKSDEDIWNELNQGIGPNIEEKKEILKERARKLAQKPEKEDVDEEQIEVIEFLLANERYSIETSFVREVFPLKGYTPLTCTPEFVSGIINLRGEIISIIDIKKFFNLPKKGLTNLNKVIVIRTDKPVVKGVKGMEFGVLTDDILGVKSILLKNIHPSLSTFTGIHEQYLMGITNDRIVVLDAEKILSDKNLIVHEDVEA